jgi:hypothetical protein
MHYYVNDRAQSYPEDGEHEVHTGNCSFLPKTENRTYLGIFTDCKEAIVEAKKIYKKVDGCYYCCEKCHKI